MGQTKDDAMETPNTDTPQAAPVESAAPTTTEKVPFLHQIRSTVKEVLATTGGTAVREAIEAELVKEGISKRAEAFAKVKAKVEEFEKTLAGIKPEKKNVNLEGKPVGEDQYTPENVKLYRETKEKLAKWHAAIDLAIGSHDFTKVFELAQKG